MTYKKIRKNPAQFLSLTGFEITIFDELVKDFEVEFNEYITHFTFEGKPRQRIYSRRKNSTLAGIDQMLLFILIYLKTNPLQEHHAAFFGMTQPKANMLIHILIPLLRKTLKRIKQLPQRDASRLEEVLKNQPNVLLDGTERPIQKPSDREIADEHYSGKKNS